ncbi:methyltransferase [Croceitalea sp. P059]|uniref:tRNA1(Val) (adenine(37)-N6)-methyltransferase n=1 Tax=Croceitalea sp. P059 TaxID=3075601 RepID=UPI002884C1CF|nr:methyltransferase [Croceitalea sp. P059]MDT0539088.1 methyltransferase [Croceitalea sp. P059]
MKVGTDGVLLGAWVSLDKEPNSILDIGAGSGLIALQLAQRAIAETIDAIELDEDSYEQCVENFEASAWGDRLFCYHASLHEFVEEMEDEYDLIVSNPPFYSEVVTSGDMARDIARQELSLPFDELINGVSKLLSKEGEFATIIPYKEEDRFISLALEIGLFVSQITRVKGTATSVIKRSLIQFSFTQTIPQEKELVIEINRHEYTLDYQELTKDFYLKM